MFGLKSGTGGLRPSAAAATDQSMWNFLSSLRYNEYVRIGNYPIGIVFHLRLELDNQVLSQDVAVQKIHDCAWQDRAVLLLFESLNDLRRRADNYLAEKSRQS